jgi:tetratricopeptide (TPR) repeat protein
MMATLISTRPPAIPARWQLWALVLVAGLATDVSGEVRRAAEPAEDLRTRYREHAARAYHAAQERHHANPDDAVLAWQFGRATFDLAEVAVNKQERETLAREGIAACRRAIALEPDLAAAHYYEGMNLGQLARVYLLRGLQMVAEMEQSFEKTRELDPRFDHGGADRNLGLLYHHAPGWPLSVGNKSKSCKHLEQAVQLGPVFPDNRLSLAEALWDTKRHEAFLNEVRAMETWLPKAREQFDPEHWAWAWAWVDWDKRWATLKARARTLSTAD